MKRNGTNQEDQKKRSPFVDEAEASRLARDVFPRIKASKAICAAIKYYALQNEYAEGTFRRKYYKWLQECERQPGDNSVWALVDGRRSRAGMVREERFFKDVLNAYQRRKNFKAAYDEILAEYQEMGLQPPCGGSMVNLIRHKERLGPLYKPRDTKKCLDCETLLQRLFATLDELAKLQKSCTNCDKLM